MEEQIAAFDGLVDTCLTTDAATIQDIYDDVREHTHCTLPRTQCVLR